MAKVVDIHSKVSRPGEYVAFFTMCFPTLEGPAFVYLACDAFSEYGFNTGTEKDEAPENILKHIYLLTEQKEFLRHRDKGFTLVLDRYEELAERIEGMVKPVNGRLLFNKEFHEQIAKPVRDSLNKFTRSGRK